LVDLGRVVNVSFSSKNIDENLQSIFSGSSVGYLILENNLVVLTSVEILQQQIVTGTVTDETGEPMPGVNVVVKGTNTGVVTDLSGRYTITVPNRDAVLVFSFMGYDSSEVIVGDQTNINLTFKEKNTMLEEVVVVGYGVQKKVNLSGAVQAISSNSLSNRPVTNANLALQGLGANVNIEALTGRANYAADINIRGYTSINGGSALILLDNVPVTAEELSRINPVDIESVSVLKDAASAAIYGGRAAYGVLLVTTKQAREDKLTINVNASVGARILSYVPDLVTDTYEVMMLQNPCSTRTPLYTAQELEYGRLRSEHPDQ
jgi:TonB-dependent SusC/RagA subfamily outer membrane receptor